MISRTGGLLAVVLLASCGGGGTFTPATPPASACALLTPADVATIFPDAMPGSGYPISGTSDLWSGGCIWLSNQPSSELLDLIIYGAKTFQGFKSLAVPPDTGTVTTPVTGLGTSARYWEQVSVGTGLWALEGTWSAILNAYLFTPPRTEAQLHPLVAKVLGQLE